MNHTPSRFTLLAGDICYANPSGNAQPIINPAGYGGTQPGADNSPAPVPNSCGWDDFDPYVWTSYFTTIEPSAASTPWMFTTGNHDVELFTALLDADPTTTGAYGRLGYGGHAQRVDLPKNGPSDCPSVYSFTYGNVGIISADANELSYEIQGLLGYSEGGQAQWLRRQLAHLRREPSIDFIVVFYHHCAFSTTDSHSSDGGVRKVLAPLLPEFDVDLAIQGHNHVYERFNPIRYDARTNTGSSGAQAASMSARDAAVVHPPTDGTTYVTVGSAGRPRYGWAGAVETDRNLVAGVDSGAPGNGTIVEADPSVGVGPFASQADFTRSYETVDWSQARYRDYAFIAVLIEVPGRPIPLAVRVSAPTAGRDLPVIVLSHGRGPSNFVSSSYGYGPLVNFWAAHGFVVIQPSWRSSRPSTGWAESRPSTRPRPPTKTPTASQPYEHSSGRICAASSTPETRPGRRPQRCWSVKRHRSGASSRSRPSCEKAARERRDDAPSPSTRA